MIDYLVSFLIFKHDYVHINHFNYEHVGLLEFFDKVMVTGGEHRLCLLKNIDKHSINDINIITNFGLEITNKTRINRKIGYQTLVFLISSKDLPEEKINKIINLPPFKKYSYYKPVIICSNSKKIYYNSLNIPIYFALLLKSIKKNIINANPISNPSQASLNNAEEKTLGKIDAFQYTLFNFRPYSTWLLILLNLISWLIFVKFYPDNKGSFHLINFGAKVSPLIWEGQIWRLLTASFLHINFFHLVINGIFLIFIGPILEPLVGHWRFLIICLISGIWGNLLSVIYSPYLSAGASSIIFGILGALIFYCYCYHKKIPKHFIRIIILFISLFIITDFLISLQFSNIDNYSHLGGLLGGIMTASILGVRYPGIISKKIRWKNVAIFSLLLIILTLAALVPYKDAYAFYYSVLGEKEVLKGNNTLAIAHVKNSLDFKKESSFKNLLGKLYLKSALFKLKNDKNDIGLLYLHKAKNNFELNEENREILFQIYQQMGFCYQKKNDYNKAIKYFKYALALKPDSSTIKNNISQEYLNLARQNILKGNKGKAKINVLIALEYNPNYEEGKIFLGVINFLDGNYYKAASLMNSALSKKINQRILKKFIFKNLWYPANISNILRLKDKKSQKINKKGEKLILLSGDYISAKHYFEKAHALSPDYSPPINNLTRVALFLGNIEKAKKLNTKSIKIKNNRFFAYSIKGLIFIQLNKKQKAIKEFKTAIKLQKYFSEPWGWTGKIYRSSGNYIKAEKFLKKAIELDENNVIWHLELARLYKEQNLLNNFWKEVNISLVLAKSQNRNELEFAARSLLFNNKKRKREK